MRRHVIYVIGMQLSWSRYLVCVFLVLNVLLFMGIITGDSIKRRWIPFICHGAMIQEKPHEVCVWSATKYPAVDILCLSVPLLGRWPIFNAVLTLYKS
jgi:hypothetical protein